MVAKFKYNVNIEIVHKIESLKELTELKTQTEMIDDILMVICDEATGCGGVAVCEVLESELDVK